jgi:hypothetical protein
MKSGALKRTTQPDTNAKSFSVDQVEVGKKSSLIPYTKRIPPTGIQTRG